MSMDVYEVSAKIIGKLESTLELSETKAALARLRNSIGRDITEAVDIWPLLFQSMPQEYLSVTGKPTREENAVLFALQLYALHQQGKKQSVNEFTKNSVAKSLSSARSKDGKALDRRFNAMLTSESLSELVTHLRHLICILKQQKDTRINYAKLADDLFWYQCSKEIANKMLLRWGQDYYFYTKEKEVKNDEK